MWVVAFQHSTRKGASTGCPVSGDDRWASRVANLDDGQWPLPWEPSQLSPLDGAQNRHWPVSEIRLVLIGQQRQPMRDRLEQTRLLSRASRISPISHAQKQKRNKISQSVWSDGEPFSDCECRCSLDARLCSAAARSDERMNGERSIAESVLLGLTVL